MFNAFQSLAGAPLLTSLEVTGSTQHHSLIMRQSIEQCQQQDDESTILGLILGVQFNSDYIAPSDQSCAGLAKVEAFDRDSPA